MTPTHPASAIEMDDDDFHRLGKADLGRHAWEGQMPDALSRQLAEEGNANALPGVIPQLARLLELDDPEHTESAYLCSLSTVQVCKLKGDGGQFCGYRNLQMLFLALRSHSSGRYSNVVEFQTKPTVLQLQDLIETAWDEGLNSHGRTQTGGIRGTRKHIGPSEAEAVLQHLKVSCTGHRFEGTNATDQLLNFVEAYFTSSLPPKSTSSTPEIHQTTRLPIFLQRPHHSITIIGFERTRSGKRRLLTFDPAYNPPSTMKKLVKESGQHSYEGFAARWALREYRKPERYFKRFRQLECLVVDS